MIMIDSVCPACAAVVIDHLVSSVETLPACEDCGATVERLWLRGPTLRPDSIPGGVWIEHGICNTDGTPRRYDSRSEMRDECVARGLVPWTDVHTEDKTKDARVRMDWYQSSEAKRAKQHRDEARAEKRLARDRAQAVQA